MGVVVLCFVSLFAFVKSFSSVYFSLSVLLICPFTPTSVYYMDDLVKQFFYNFNHHYQKALDTNFCSLSLVEQVEFIKHLYEVNSFQFIPWKCKLWWCLIILVPEI